MTPEVKLLVKLFVGAVLITAGKGLVTESLGMVKGLVGRG